MLFLEDLIILLNYAIVNILIVNPKKLIVNPKKLIVRR